MQIIDDYINSVRFPAAGAPPRCAGVDEALLKRTDVDSSKVVKLISFDPA